MNQVAATVTETGLLISGEIRFENVLKVRRQGDRLLNTIASPDIKVDLSGVTSSDVSGLSLLLRWLHHAGKQGKRIQYTSIPSSLLKVASVCGVSKLIGE